MNCPNQSLHHNQLDNDLKEGQVKGYYICEECKSVWYIAKVGEIH